MWLMLSSDEVNESNEARNEEYRLQEDSKGHDKHLRFKPFPLISSARSHYSIITN